MVEKFRYFSTFFEEFHFPVKNKINYLRLFFFVVPIAMINAPNVEIIANNSLFFVMAVSGSTR